MRGIGSIGLLGVGTLLAVVIIGRWYGHDPGWQAFPTAGGILLLGLLFGSLHAVWLFGDFDFRDVEFDSHRHLAVLAVPWVIAGLILMAARA